MDNPPFTITLAAADYLAKIVDFTLKALLVSLEEQIEHQVKHQVEHQVKHAVSESAELSLTQVGVLNALRAGPLTCAYRRHVEPLVSRGFVEMTHPGKPRSRSQRYRLTQKGRALDCVET